MDLTILAALLRSLATVAGDPALGYRGAAVVSVLELISVALKAGSQGWEDLQKLHAQVDAMVAENREPTKDEWAELRERSRVAHDILNPPPPPEPEPAPETESPPA